MAAQFCPFCGKPVTAAGATFCAFCGRSLTDQAPPQSAPQPSQQPQPPQPSQLQPLPPGANPPGMVAVPPSTAPVDGPPPGPAAGPVFYPPASGYGAEYPPPGFVAPPPTYAAYVTYAAPGYAPVVSARPAFSTARAVWCAVGVAVVAIGGGVWLIFAPFVPFMIFWYGHPVIFPIAFGIPSSYWLGLVRLPYSTTWRALAEVTGVNMVLLLVFIGIGFEFNYVASPTFIVLYFPGFIGLLPIVAFSILGALVASAIGIGFACVFANWPVLRAYAVIQRTRTLLLQVIGGIIVAFLLVFAAMLIYTRLPDQYFAYYFYRFGKAGVIFIAYLPLIIIAILIALAATWSTLRLLRRSAVAPPMPVAPGV